jgi:MerR family transcriptional regulator, light-induced transcriptional regulator
MQDIHHRLLLGGWSDEQKPVVNFASQVVAMLAERSGESHLSPRSDLLAALVDGAQSGDPDALDVALAELRRQRVSLSNLADLYIPEAARFMGCAWEEDRMSFADVTMGTARLQMILREIGQNWRADNDGADRGTVLCVLGHGEQHSLGASVLTGQLRRLGVSVCLRLASNEREIAALLSATRFDAVFLSASGLEKAARAARGIRRGLAAAGQSSTLVLGGFVAQEQQAAKAETLADIVTNDLSEALSAAGLSANSETRRKRA